PGRAPAARHCGAARHSRLRSGRRDIHNRCDRRGLSRSYAHHKAHSTHLPALSTILFSAVDAHKPRLRLDRQNWRATHGTNPEKQGWHPGIETPGFLPWRSWPPSFEYARDEKFPAESVPTELGILAKLPAFHRWNLSRLRSPRTGRDSSANTLLAGTRERPPRRSWSK